MFALRSVPGADKRHDNGTVSHSQDQVRPVCTWLCTLLYSCLNRCLATKYGGLYRVDWEPAAPSRRRRVLGLSRGWQRPCGDNLHPVQLRFHGLLLKNWPIFPVMWILVDWPHVAQVRFWRPKKASFGKTTCHLANPPYHGTRNCGLSKISGFHLCFTFYGSEVVFWVKKQCFGVFSPSVR